MSDANVDTVQVREIIAGYRFCNSSGGMRGCVVSVSPCGPCGAMLQLEALADEVDRLHKELSETKRVGALAMTKKCDEVDRLREQLATQKSVAEAYRGDAKRWSDACDACINEITTVWEPLLAAVKNAELAMTVMDGEDSIRALKKARAVCEEKS